MRPRHAYILTVAVLCALLFFLGLLPAHKNPEQNAPKLLHITTNTVPLLSPHTHTTEDAVGDHGHGVNISAEEVVTTEDMWVRGIRVTVHNAPHTTLHHVNILTTRPTTPSPSASAKEKFLGEPRGISVGQDIAETVAMPPPYAGFIPKGTRIQVSAMLHNPLPPRGPGEEYKDVSVSIDVLGISFDSALARETASIYMTLIDKDSRTNDTFSVPPRTLSFVRRSEDPQDSGRGRFTFPVSGTIVGMGAHLHAWEGGQRVDVFLNGTPLHSFTPYLNGQNPWDWQTDYAVLTLHVNAGDVLTMSSTYDNLDDETERGAMAIVVTNFAPD